MKWTILVAVTGIFICLHPSNMVLEAPMIAIIIQRPASLALPPKTKTPHVVYKIGHAYSVSGHVYHPKFHTQYHETGIASYYGVECNQRVTANGDVFDPHLLTAAHPTLPIPSIARITNTENGKSVYVVINDRGPFAAGRSIDLSWQAAKQLDYIVQGTTHVRIDYDHKRTIAYLKSRGLYEKYRSATHRSS